MLHPDLLDKRQITTGQRLEVGLNLFDVPVPPLQIQQIRDEFVVKSFPDDSAGISGSDGIPEWAALDFQLNYFRQVLRKNLKHRGRRIVFIHGVGDGTLASAIRKELDDVFAISCTYTPGPMGVTNVTIR
jgi:hypothetical protein